MKRPTVLIFVGLICCACVQSQDKFMRDAADNSHSSGAQQFSLGYGINSFPLHSEKSGTGIRPSSVDLQFISATSTGAFCFSYLNDVVYKFAWGFDAAFERVNSSYLNSENARNTFNIKYFSFMPKMSYRYINHEKFQIYSGLAVGFNYGFTESNGSKIEKANLAYQGTAVGMRVGNNFALFGELGYGYRGVINGGISCRF